MAVIALKGVSFDHGGPPLLDRADFTLEDGERLALVGRNGTGKSTLLALLAGLLEPSSGTITRRQRLRVGFLPQSLPAPAAMSVADGVRRAMEAAGRDGWTAERRVDEVLAGLALDGSAPMASLSAGTLRRALLAAAIAPEPDLLLLDEPTNHLDIESVRTVEELIRAHPGAVLFVSHDRRFVDDVATGIVELDRGRLTRYPGGWSAFLERRDAALEAEAHARAVADKRLEEEETWIRRGVKARRARNMGRVRRLLAMREEHRARRSRAGSAEIAIQQVSGGGHLVIRAKGAGFDYGGPPVVRDLDLDLLRGDRLGIVGPNGSGKSTVVKLLIGELAPRAGTVQRGTNLEIAWFDQHQEQLDPEARVQDAVAGGATTVSIDGESRHVITYLGDYLFTPQQCRGVVGKLSGGERNRLMLARLFARRMNLLVLDEPTNDLDLETLELLEDALASFAGTLIVVSHDRAFLDNVVASTLACEGGGRWKEYDGGWTDCERARAQSPARAEAAEKPAAKPAAKAPPPDAGAAEAAVSAAARPKRLSHRERRELDELPARIEALEAEQAALHAAMADPSFFKKDGATIAAATARLAALGDEVSRAYSTWTDLLERE